MDLLLIYTLFLAKTTMQIAHWVFSKVSLWSCKSWFNVLLVHLFEHSSTTDGLLKGQQQGWRLKLTGLTKLIPKLCAAARLMAHTNRSDQTDTEALCGWRLTLTGLTKLIPNLCAVDGSHKQVWPNWYRSFVQQQGWRLALTGLTKMIPKLCAAVRLMAHTNRSYQTDTEALCSSKVDGSH